MKILLVDNGTIRLDQLYSLLSRHEIITINPTRVGAADMSSIDLVVLSGGSKFPIVGNESVYDNEINLIRNIDMPIIGICLGFELIAYSFGAELIEMPAREKGLLEILTFDEDGIFDNLPNFKVYESHRWVVRNLPGELSSLAVSKDGIEVTKHKTKPIFGFQFHPEMLVDQACGDEIFFNAVRRIKNPPTECYR